MIETVLLRTCSNVDYFMCGVRTCPAVVAPKEEDLSCAVPLLVGCWVLVPDVLWEISSAAIRLGA